MTTKTTDYLHDDIRIAVWEWIREKAPTSIKLMMTHEMSDELIGLIEIRMQNDPSGYHNLFLRFVCWCFGHEWWGQECVKCGKLRA